MKKIPKSSKVAHLSCGVRVLYTYTRKGRRVVVPVRIMRISSALVTPRGSKLPPDVEITSYIVSSGRGGELRVSAGELRPDTALDRIVVALDAMDDA